MYAGTRQVQAVSGLTLRRGVRAASRQRTTADRHACCGQSRLLRRCGAVFQRGQGVKLHADWNSISASTFSGPFLSLTPTSWSKLPGASQAGPTPGNAVDTQYPRPTGQSQYSNIGGVEALWISHTVGASGTSSPQAAVRYYQVGVTGGAVAAKATQAFTYSPDTAVFRFMPSLAVDRRGDMAMGYSATNARLNPAIRYAGRLAGDPVNSITQTEQTLIEGTGTQSGDCGSSPAPPPADIVR